MRGLRRPGSRRADEDELVRTRRELDRHVAEIAARIEMLRSSGALDDVVGLDATSRRKRDKAVASARLGYAALGEMLGRFVVLESDGRAFVISAVDARIFKRQETKEARLLRAVLRHLHAAGVPVTREIFVDGGANVGTECMAALALGFAHIVACEPQPENFRLLLANLALNGESERVHALEVALSSEEGRGRLDPGNYTRREARLVTVGETIESDDVRTTSLDRLAADGVFDPSRVGLLWLDVEGYEGHVLRGAQALLEQAVPIVMELNMKLLDPADSLHDLSDTLSARYTHVLDLGLPNAGFERLDGLSDLIWRYAPDDATNVLVTRLVR